MRIALHIKRGESNFIPASEPKFKSSSFLAEIVVHTVSLQDRITDTSSPVSFVINKPIPSQVEVFLSDFPFFPYLYYIVSFTTEPRFNMPETKTTEPYPAA